MSTPVPVILMPGTWSYKGLFSSKGQWYHPDSFLPVYISAYGLRVLVDARGRGFIWDGGLEGLRFWRPLLGMEPDLQEWEIAGANFYDRQLPITVDPQYHMRGCDTNVWCHSHGINPVLVAAALGLRINTLVSFGSPIRKDVIEKYGAEARRNIGFHLHYWSAGDSTQVLGGIGDGDWGVRRRYPLADQNVKLPDEAGHSGILYDPKFSIDLHCAIDITKDRHGRADYLTYRPI